MKTHEDAFLTSVQVGGEWLASRFDHFTPEEEAGCAPRAGLDAVAK
jgi:hypothetical protein